MRPVGGSCSVLHHGVKRRRQRGYQCRAIAGGKGVVRHHRHGDTRERGLQVDDAVAENLVTERCCRFNAHDLRFKVGYPFGKGERLVVRILLCLEQRNLVVLLGQLIDRACGRVLVASEEAAEAVATEQARGDCSTDGTDDAGSEAGSSYALGGVFLFVVIVHHLIISFQLVCLKAYREPPESAFSIPTVQHDTPFSYRLLTWWSVMTVQQSSGNMPTSTSKSKMLLVPLSESFRRLSLWTNVSHISTGPSIFSIL